MERKRFINDVADKMRDGMCDLFIGSGISASSKLPTWTDFLSPYLSELGIQVRDEDNLPLLAQYIENYNTGNRNIISNAIFKTFGKDYALNDYHAVISSLPVKTVWTTNYDGLLEKAFADRDIRVIASEDMLEHPHNNAGLEIIKLHGSANTAAKDIVLTQADYDCFLYDKPKLAQRLREAMINHCILFLGYSFHDPNIQAIMTQAYQMMRKMTGTHYILLAEIRQREGETEAAFTQRKIRFNFWRSELNRIGICELCVPREDIIAVLKEINEASHEKAVLVTGPHDGDEQMMCYAQKIGNHLAKIPEVILNYGQSSGIGGAAMSSFMEYVVNQRQDVNQRIRIFPNPYAISPAYANDPTLITSLKKARMALIANSAVVIIFPGHMGTKAEIELALAKDKLVFPVLENKEHFKNEVISFLLTSCKNNVLLEKKAPQYYEKLKQEEVPAQEETLEAIREIMK